MDSSVGLCVPNTARMSYGVGTTGVRSEKATSYPRSQCVWLVCDARNLPKQVFEYTKRREDTLVFVFLPFVLCGYKTYLVAVQTFECEVPHRRSLLP